MRIVDILQLSAVAAFSVVLVAFAAPQLKAQADEVEWHEPEEVEDPSTSLPAEEAYQLEGPAHPPFDADDPMQPAPEDECTWRIRYTFRDDVSESDSGVHEVTVFGVTLTYGGWSYSGTAQFWAAKAESSAWGQRTFKTYTADMPTITTPWEIDATKTGDCGVGFVWTQAASVIEARASRQLPIVTPSTASAQAYAARKITCSEVGLDWDHGYGAEVPSPGGGGTSVSLGPVSIALESGDDSAGDIKKDYSGSKSAQTDTARWDTTVWAKVLSEATTKIDGASAESSVHAREFWIAIQLRCIDPDCNYYRDYMFYYVPDVTPIPVLRRTK